jgi:hypothetical protein
MSDKPTPKIVKSEGPRPCGCYVTEYADGTAQVSPCPPCGLMDAARNLGGAAQALAAVATRLRQESGQAAVAAAARAVAQGKIEVAGG